MAKAKEAGDELFSTENQVRANFIKLETVGQTWTGVYVEKRVAPNRLANDGSLQTVYTLIQDDGTPLYAAGRTEIVVNAQKNKVIPGLEQAKPGEFIGLKYERQLEAKGGKQGAKLLGVYNKHELKKEVLDAYFGTGDEGKNALFENEVPFS